MGTRIADAPEYAHLWASGELRELFDDTARLQSWLDILTELAAAQADLGIVPAGAAQSIREHARADRLRRDVLVDETRRTGHSTLGLIRALQQMLPEHAREWVYYGATVQDLTDSWTALTAKWVGAIVRRDLLAIEDAAVELAERHRDTPMVGRTHGQPGAPITFGFKAATWADEVRRHIERLEQGRPRWEVGQLGDAVGTLAFFGERGLELRERFCARLGLHPPAISWLTARDRVAEFGHVLAMVAATLGRIGNEIYTLQRAEIGELREPSGHGSVGSITMPHKRNPEVSEHLVTLSRLVRANAGVLLEGMLGEHERDGRSWKAEWVAFPEVCLLTGASAALAREVLAGLEVDADAMASNLAATGGDTASERLLAELAPRLGKHRAQEVLQEAIREGRERGEHLSEVLEHRHIIPGISGIPDQTDRPDTAAEARPSGHAHLIAEPDVGCAPAMVDAVVGTARAARRDEGA